MGRGINKALRLFKKSKIEDIKSGKEKSFTDLKTFKSLFKRKFAPLYKQKVEEVNLKQFKADWEYKSGMNLDAPVGLSKEEKEGILKGHYTKRELKNLARKISGGNKEMQKWLTGVKFNEKGEIIGGKGYRKNKRIIAGEVSEAYDKMKGGVHDKYRFKDPFDEGWTQSLDRPSLPKEVWDEEYNPTPPPITPPTVDLITPEITPTKLDIDIDKYSLEKSVRTKTTDGRPMTPWEIWFGQQPPGTTQKYPGDSGTPNSKPVPPGEFSIEFIPGISGTPPTTTTQTNYIVTKNGVPLGDLNPKKQAHLYKQARREYLKTAVGEDKLQLLFYEEYGPNGSRDEFDTFKQEYLNSQIEPDTKNNK
jgi:hypothetical protein